MALEKIGVEATIQGLSSFRRGIGQMEGDVRGFGRTTDGLLPGLNRMGDSLLNIGGIAAGAVVAGLAAATAGVVAFAGSGIKAAVDMEDQMGNIAAVMNTTKEAIQPLSDLIVDLGIDPGLKVTAEEAANAIELLARNGLTMQEILDGAARSTVLLANATGAEFGNAADIATDAMAIFNIEAKDMQGTVDSIVSVTTNSKFTIDDFSLALRNGGAAAAIMNVSMEDFNTVIAASAEEMGSGMRAGTGFRNFLTRLTPNSDKAAEAMRTLGLVTADGTNAFFDTNGQLKDMAEVSGILQQALFGTSTVMTEVGGRTADQNRELERLQGIYNRTLISIQDYTTGVKGAGLSEAARENKLEDLNLQLANTQAQMSPLLAIQGDLIESTKTLTDAERSAFLETIFGQDALGTAIALANEGQEGFAALAASMSETDAAAAALERMDSVAGVLEILGGVIDTIQLQIGQAFLPIIRDLADWFLRIANDIGPKVTGVFDRVASAISGAVSFIQKGGTPMQAFATALLRLGVPPQTIKQIREFIGSVKDVVDTITAFVSEHAEAFKGAIAGIGAVLAGSVIVSVLTSIAGVIATILSPIGLLIIGVAALGAAWQSNFGNIQGITFGVIGAIQNLIAVFQEGGLLGVLITLTESWSLNWEMIQAVVMTAWEVIQGVISSAVAIIKPAIDEFISGATEGFGSFAPLMETFKGLWEALQPVITTVLAVVGAALLAFIGVVVGVVNGIAQAIQPLLATFALVFEGIVTALTGVIEFVTSFVQIIIALFQGNNEAVQAAWQKMGEGVTKIVTGLIETIVAAVSGLVLTVLEFIEGLVSGVVDFFKNLYDELVGNSIIVDLVEDILKLFFDLATDLLNSISRMVDDLIDLVVTFAADMLEKFTNMVYDIIGLFNNTDWSALGQAIIDGLVNAIKNGGAAVIGAITDLANSAIDSAKEALGIGSPSKVFAEIGANLGQGLILGINSTAQGVQESIAALFDIGGALGGIGGGFANQLKSTVFPQMEKVIEDSQRTLDSFKGQFVGKFGSVLGITDADQLTQQKLVDAYFVAIHSGNKQMEQDILTVWQAQANLTSATDEYKQAQADIVALQKAQADLAFLEQQQKLLDLIVENGLNAQDILGGLELGLGADTQGLVQAMTRAIQAIVDQANQQLQIASPSGVFEQIGKYITTGLAQGINQTATSPAQAMESMLNSMVQPMQAQAALPSVINQPSTTTITKSAQVDMSGMQVGSDMDLQFLGDFVLQKVSEAIQ